MRVTRVLRVLAPLIFGAVIAVSSLPSSARASGTPVLVADLDTGRVLYSERATDPWYPASVTKLMTTFVALHEVRAGRARMDSLLPVSAEAARMPPSKMGFKPGTEIRLDNALKIILVKSANDVAATIAEGLGGSIDGFAAMMNAQAARLGMRETRFSNPHGLPDPRQQTSARDMALLARAILIEFPEHSGLFNIGAVQYGKTVMRNTNGLIGRYAGASGMKTGYICSSGFNVVATAQRGGRRLVAVVMGSPSAQERTLKSASLFEYGFSSFGLLGQNLESLAPSPIISPPDLRPLICGGKKPVGEDEADSEIAADRQVVTANGASPSIDLFAGQASAYAGVNQGIVLPKVTLGPRAAATPIPVWLGLERATSATASKSGGRSTRNVPLPPPRPKKLADANPKPQAR